jgi:hypothetical protein
LGMNPADEVGKLGALFTQTGALWHSRNRRTSPTVLRLE